MAAKSDVVVKLVLVFFISLLSFSIGTFVGKKYSDNQHKLAALEPEKNEATAEKREVASLNENSGHEAKATEHSGQQKLSDEEIAKLAEEFVADDSKKEEATEEHTADTHGAPAHATAKEEQKTQAAHHEAAPTHEAPAPAHGTAEPSHVAQNLAHGKAPVETPTHNVTKESRIPTSLPKDVAQYSVGKFTVQIAAYGSETEAKQRAEDLKQKGYSAFYVPAHIKGKTWYRVSVGLFATEKEAKDYKADFMTKTKVDSAMVQKITN